jgi:hypothetical protein
MTTPRGGIPAGTLFGYGPRIHLGTLWEKVEGTFSLGLDGDNMFLYCKTNLYKTRFLSGFTNNYDWAMPFLDEADYGHNSSALPESLVASSINLPHKYNYFYNGPRDARVNQLRRNILDPNEWRGSNELQYSILDTPVEVAEGSSGSKPAPRSPFLGSLLAMTCCSLAWECLNW